jgi:arsenate reductase
VEYQKINYYKEALSHRKLKELLKKMKLHAKDILREREPAYKELGLQEKKDRMSEDELIDLMIQHPDLMQRPIVERGNHAVLARPLEKMQELL